MASVNEKLPLLGKANISIDEETTSGLPTIREEAWDILKLGIPIFIARLSFVGMKTTDTALLGHVSRKALSAAALSDLWTMCSQVLLYGQVLGVFIGGAIGAGNPKLAGVYLQVSFMVLGCMAIFVIIAWLVTEQVWLAFGSDPEISAMAGYYSSVLSLAVPGILVFGQMSQFFSAQRIMNPEVNSASIGLLMNLVFGLILVLGWPIPGVSTVHYNTVQYNASCQFNVLAAVPHLISYVHHLPRYTSTSLKDMDLLLVLL
jgi:Na+-driven multidrug efflux pump